MKKMTLKELIDFKAADIWDECKGNWIVWDHYDSHERLAFFKVFPHEPFWDDDSQGWIWNDKNWKPDECVESFVINMKDIELTDKNISYWTCKFPLNKSFGQTFSE